MTKTARIALLIVALVVVMGIPLPSTAGPRTCLGRRATVVGTPGDDVLTGTPRADVMVGLAGADILDGLRGNDLVCGGAGGDVISGSGGNDRLSGGRGSDGVFYGGSRRSMNVNLATGGATGEGADRLVGVENISGSNHPDVLVGNDGSNIIFGEGGADAIDAGGGLDLVTGDDADDDLDGGEGFDLVVYGFATAGVSVDLTQGTAIGEGTDSLSRLEVVIGSESNDSLRGDDASNFLFGAGGDDTLDGAGGFDYAGFWFAAEPVDVNLETDRATGEGSDVVAGVEGVFGSVDFGDTLTGDEQSNFLDGDAGNDALHGGGSDDLLVGGPGDDLLDGGEGSYDFVDFFAEATVDADLGRGTATGEGNDLLRAIEALRGAGGNDVLTGDSGPNFLFGWTGDDTLVGGGGDDFLDGGDGSDSADGGDGSDNCVFIEAAPVLCEGTSAAPVHPLVAFAEEIERLKRFAKPNR